MREVGTMFGTFLGIFVPHESRGVRRIFGAIIIGIGVVLIGVLG